MCLATVYKNPENTVVCKNVSRIDVDGEYVLIRDIMGEEIRLQGKIKMVDLGFRPPGSANRNKQNKRTGT